MNIKPIVVPLLLAVVAVSATWYLTHPGAKTYGTPVGAELATVAIGDLDASRVGQQVAIEGTIDQECPTSGCWAVIKDDTGVIRIDTERGGFSLPLHREGSRVRIVGTVTKTDAGNVEISAETASL